jgi:hypothetical protein
MHTSQSFLIIFVFIDQKNNSEKMAYKLMLNYYKTYAYFFLFLKLLSFFIIYFYSVMSNIVLIVRAIGSFCIVGVTYKYYICINEIFKFVREAFRKERFKESGASHTALSLFITYIWRMGYNMMENILMVMAGTW